VKAVYDKGSGIVVVLEGTTSDAQGQVLARHERSLFIRGLGGYGGERGPSGKEHMPPVRPPDKVHRERTAPNQALLYRLSGDRNPIHADPAVAKAAGFPRPILHGLCTYGFAGRALLKQWCDNDPARFKSIKARFAQPFFPGETLLTEMWQVEPGRVIFQCKSAERDVVVLSGGAVEIKN
jgi:3-hydroxyacyl-CoA dehydrogenase/3a,7a,12a-trihydroxy-5b-cholest-24-enoyl-CoA hydratase